MIRALVQKVLKANGYTTLVAESGPAALRLAGQHDGRIHLLMTDVVMPGMNGREVAERLAPAHAGIKVLYLSGYTDDRSEEHTSELQSRLHLVCRLLLEKKKKVKPRRGVTATHTSCLRHAT